MKTLAQANGSGNAKSYIITSSLLKKIRILKTSLGLTVSDGDKAFCEESRCEVEKFVSRYFPGANIFFVDMDQLGDEVFSSAVKAHSAVRGATLLSTCSEFTELHKGKNLQINRIFDCTGQKIGLGPRPGYPTIDEQIKQFMASFRGDPIVIIEDGSFTGTTLAFIIKKFRAAGAKIDSIILGFAFPKAIENITEVYDGKIIQMQQMDNIIDWMPDHDFFPFLPNCGRVVGHAWGEQNLPLYGHDGAAFCIPYIMPFVNRETMEAWTGIPKVYCQEFSDYFLKKALRFYEGVERELGEPLTIKHLANTTPRICTPLSVNQKTLPDVHASVTEFIRDCLH
ncbi:phosphoribosyltransferase [Candidatus Falkowbacteria bacterium]|nr:phosphoribosyltransferase [Candidatus Falkowbacteria bacterium]